MKEELSMKKNILVGVVAAFLVLSGAVAVGATQFDDSKHQEDRKISVTNGSQTKSTTNVKGQKLEVETEHGQTYIKFGSDDRGSSTGATNMELVTSKKTAVNVTGTIKGVKKEVEEEVEHGKVEFKKPGSGIVKERKHSMNNNNLHHKGHNGEDDK